MRNLIIGLIIGFLLGGIVVAQASTNISVEKIFNKCFDSATNSLNVEAI